MRRKKVESSMILSVGYRKSDKTLEIEFKDSGRIYQYDRVPSYIFTELMEAESKGRYFLNWIRGAYDYWRVR